MKSKEFKQMLNRLMGEEVRSKRIEAGLSQDQLMKEFERIYVQNGVETEEDFIAKSTISKYENGEYKIPAYYLLLLEKTLELLKK